MKRIIIASAAALATVIGLGACSFSDDSVSDPAFQTLRYEGGDTGGSKFKECVDEGEKIISNDRYYSYPKTQRQDKFDSDNFQQGANSADYPDMQLAATGGIGLNLKITVPFNLNVSCKPVKVGEKEYRGGTLQAFHEIFGKTRNAYFDTKKDGNGSYGDGWLWMMDTYISTCVKQVLTPQVRALNPEKAWLDDTIRLNLIDGLKEKIQACVDNGMETDLQFYIIGNPTIDSITPDEQFVALYRQRQEAETKAQTAEANKNAQIAEAQAKAAVAQQEAKVKAAEISGYGGIEGYLRHEAIEKGLNPFPYTGGNNLVSSESK